MAFSRTSQFPSPPAQQTRLSKRSGGHQTDGIGDVQPQRRCTMARQDNEPGARKDDTNGKMVSLCVGFYV